MKGEVISGSTHHLIPSGNACLVFIGDKIHYMLFEYYEPNECSQPDFYAVGLHVGR